VIAGAVAPVHATFHFIQVEQIIGGVNGDTTAQAIQVRFRSGGQHFQANGRIRAWDAAGANPITIVDPVTNLAGPSSTGDRVLFASANFVNYLDSAIAIDYTLSALIPSSYLAAGSLTFEDNTGTTIYWRISWGGASYTGSNAGAVTNDGGTTAGDFGPPMDVALPSTGINAFQFQGIATAVSTQNIDDYLETARGATFTNYAGASANVFIPVVTGACCMTDGSCAVDTTQTACENAGGTYQGDNVGCGKVECPQPPDCIADLVDNATFMPPPDGQVDGADLGFLLGQWGRNVGSLADIVDNGTFMPPPDGTVDGADLAFLLGSWGSCR